MRASPALVLELRSAARPGREKSKMNIIIILHDNLFAQNRGGVVTFVFYPVPSFVHSSQRTSGSPPPRLCFTSASQCSLSSKLVLRPLSPISLGPVSWVPCFPSRLEVQNFFLENCPRGLVLVQQDPGVKSGVKTPPPLTARPSPPPPDTHTAVPGSTNRQPKEQNTSSTQGIRPPRDSQSGFCKLNMW